MINVKNVRIDVVHREGDKDWKKCGRYLSIRAYRDTGQLMMGPDIPITNGLTDAQIEHLTKLLLQVVCGLDDDALPFAA
ncbi:hypothetical protein [Bradyrhizobium sp. NBAIM02]|uniref:hypothetical protein n=1 Tax=Bradyrhizobium sp. NBAIM02 TaxID=2793817 RepID=UPI001CD37D13|nr:hypothetical protein [Bradyrhizobium sp. NBAIM02]MCA1503803.1 hypothetical protein [Bradyrhizobium sp. NBAIM02]